MRFIDERESSNNGDDSSSEITIKSLKHQIKTLRDKIKAEKEKKPNTK